MCGNDKLALSHPTTAHLLPHCIERDHFEVILLHLLRHIVSIVRMSFSYSLIRLKGPRRALILDHGMQS